jgi:hypothetical protein
MKTMIASFYDLQLSSMQAAYRNFISSLLIIKKEFFSEELS